MVCFRFVIANTLHKGDIKDDDDYDNNNKFYLKKYANSWL
jgi:hypothetical protein